MNYNSTSRTFHHLIPKQGTCLKNTCLTGWCPLFSTGGRRRGACPCSASARFGFAGFALKHACVQHGPRSQMLAEHVIAMWICRFPGILPADITTASLFVLFNHAPTLKLPSNYCSQLLGAQEPTLITEFPAREVAAGCAAWSWRHCFKPASTQDHPLLWEKRQRFPVSVAD